MSGAGTRRSPIRDSSADTSNLRQYTPTLLDYAEKLIVDMRATVPNDLKVGTQYQLSGKKIDGIDCSSILILKNRAIYVDLSTGVVITVDEFGRRRTSMIRVPR